MVQIFVYFVQVLCVIKANNAHKAGERSSDELQGCGLAALAYEIYSVGFLVRCKKISINKNFLQLTQHMHHHVPYTHLPRKEESWKA